MDYGRIVSLKRNREGAELLDELNRELDRVIRVVPGHSELSAALRTQFTRRLVTLRVDEDVDPSKEVDLQTVDRPQGWGVLVSSGCVVDEILATAQDVKEPRRRRKGSKGST